jgi:hypothetical protein
MLFFQDLQKRPELIYQAPISSRNAHSNSHSRSKANSVGSSAGKVILPNAALKQSQIRVQPQIFPLPKL